MARRDPGSRSACADTFSCDLPPSLHHHPRSERTVLTAQLAAIEMLARLGRHLPVEAAGAVLAGWPEDIRRQPAEDALARLRELPREAPAPGPARLLVVLTGEGEGREMAEETVTDGVRLRCRLDGGRIGVEAGIAAGDPWEPMAAAVAEIFAELFRALLSAPALRPDEAAGIGEASKAAVLGRLAGEAVDHGPFRSIPAMIEAQADLTPGRPALSHDGRTLDYHALDGLANALARDLAARGLGRGDLLPVFMVNGLEMPVTYLAAMKIGAAFVPFDPAWPESRVEAALGILSAKLVACTHPGLLPAPRRAAALRVDLSRIEPEARRPAVAIGPGDAIYGIFTSGTTGTPKCAVNLHGGLANRFLFMTRYFQADESLTVLQNSRHTFDSSVWQMFWPLTLGGHAVVPAQGEFLNLEGTIETIGRYGVTMTDFVPTIFNMMVALIDRDAQALAKVSTLERLIVGGEEITPQAVHRLGELLPGVRITNGYGPTEASIGMIFHTVSPDDGDRVPLGRPIDNCYALVLSEDLQLLPPGAQGEIVIGGACLGAGYHGDPVRTRASFVPNTFPGIPGERLYRTGDLGRHAPDGRLHFLGRKDFQVKIGGVRIELGEIETAALGCPGVTQAKVLVARQEAGKSLALFASGDAALAEGEVREHLRRSLPRNSLPRHCLILPEMPLTSHGKVDRQRLHEILEDRLARDARRLDVRHPGGQEDGAAEDGAAEAGGPVLGRVLRIFRAALGKPDLGTGDSFVEAGGDSLQALAAVHDLQAAFGLRLGVQELFGHQTAEAMACLVEDRRAGPQPPARGPGSVAAERELIERDADLGPGFAPLLPPADAAAEIQTILLTGATGFVGARTLHELLTRTTAGVVCLVRAENDLQAHLRIVEALAAQGLWQEAFTGRIEAMAGDLSRPGLGLAPETRVRLAKGCDAVMNVAAMVNFLLGYHAHRAANVLGVKELLHLALEHRPKPFLHVSTLGTLDCEASRRGTALAEDFDPAAAVMPDSGYSRSKWTASRLLLDARSRGATVTLLRLGEIMPAADNGHPNRHALTHFLLRAFAKLRACPDVPMRSDFTPVDYAAERLVAALFDRACLGGTLHVFHPESVCFTRILERAGLPVDRVSCTEFLRHLDRAALATGERELRALQAILSKADRGSEDTLRLAFGQLLVDNPRLFRKDECRALEARHGLADPPLDGAAAAYRDRLLEGGAPSAFLEATA
jgi:amino acid adenylation domain-containing protein/thioester reductase-like protein